MRQRILVHTAAAGVLLAALSAGCGGNNAETEPADSQQRSEKQRSERQKSERGGAQVPAIEDFTGPVAEAYQRSKAFCGSGPPRAVAQRLGLTGRLDGPRKIARIGFAVAGNYSGRERFAAYKGCMSVLPYP